MGRSSNWELAFGGRGATGAQLKRCRIDALFDDTQMSAGNVDLVCDVGKVAQRTAEAIEARYDQRIALAQYFQRQIELIPTIALGTASLLFEYDCASVIVPSNTFPTSRALLGLL